MTSSLASARKRDHEALQQLAVYKEQTAAAVERLMVEVKRPVCTRSRLRSLQHCRAVASIDCRYGLDTRMDNR